ncbi:hypothetical protein [Pseudonocardia sp. HH130630-07]|uniref:hypothetical protein n=1 Tax=Pseudonocardia sp. HH130630-07 TaxID=1690815 RepID=UPI0008150A7D|nr:hypothetical protein [Pseudonocardia sp. HH130630-07]ANY06385.1 hypothetical protein AFB00_08870 [Pseudonocardia sp. HH130630-07]
MSRPSFLPTSHVGVSLHWHEGAPARVDAYAAEDRVTVRLGSNTGAVTVFLDRFQLARLRDVLAQAEVDLDAGQRQLAEEISGAGALE